MRALIRLLRATGKSQENAVTRLVGWTERRWSFELAPSVFPAVVDRLRGTSARSANLVAGITDAVLSFRSPGQWSVKEHLGHLNDLHALDMCRLDEFLSRSNSLTPADMDNRRTFEANHGATPISELLERSRANRAALVERLTQLSEEDVRASAIHPRLRRRVRLIDWAEFVADHDDHHLVRAREVLAIVGANG